MAESQNDIEAVFRKRTRAVGIGHTTGRLLLAINRDANGDPASPIYRQYGHMMSCNSRLIQEDGKVRGVHHCKCRACIQCNRTRTAVLINEYKPRLEEEKDSLYFVTLTRRNVRAEDLPGEIMKYVKLFKAFTQTQYFRKGSLQKRREPGSRRKSILPTRRFASGLSAWLPTTESSSATS